MTITKSPRSILRRSTKAPPVYDDERAARAWTDLEKAIDALEPGELRSDLESLIGDPRSREILKSIFGNSGYLTRLSGRLTAELPQIFLDEPEEFFNKSIRELDLIASAETSLEDLMAVLRRTKEKLAFLIAAADISGVWELFEVTSALTRMADASLIIATRWLFAQAEQTGKFKSSMPERPEVGSGFAIIAMGKHGAGELNYSSDIDIMVFFDEAHLSEQLTVEPREFCVRLTKQLVKIIQEMTAEGYVFRVDLRLRPDAGATPVAISMEAAEQYYESMGQNWERAAMIKARAAAGDIEAGKQFLANLRPFIWRKHLDYAAIEDIHSIKRQIHRQGGHRAIGVAGHNVKLGLGGIREIEFFVQTQQLILGGRHEALRDRVTCSALGDLAKAGVIDENVAADLVDSYVYLRTVEHRLQMREDAQTHVIPSNEDDLENVARFSGYKLTSDFESDVLTHLKRVSSHYNALFEQEDPLSSTEGALVFTGVEDDPETVDTLSKMGFQRASQVAATIRNWHFGRIRATRSKRAREILTKLVPVILKSISKTSDPDVTFARFQDFLAGMPSGVQLFSLFLSHQELLELVTDALGTAPRLGPYLAKNSSVLDALLDSDFLTSLPEREVMADELAGALKPLSNFEEILDQSRRWGKDHAFRIGLQVLRGTLHADAAGKAYAELADIVIAGLLPAALADVEHAHGKLEASSFAVIAMGKLGGRELSATSDVDLIFVYDYEGDAATSDGSRPLPGPRYFARVAQRFIAALSAPTAEGILYEVDMQLRPSGSSGPIATKLDGFRRYYEQEAWNWERLALTRGRVIAGGQKLRDDVQKTIDDVLRQARDRRGLAQDVLDMRERLVREKGTDSIWDIKHVRGGLIDLEFACQYLQLVFASDHPEILDQNTCTVYRKVMNAALIPDELARSLIDAADLMHNLTQVMRIAIDGKFRPEDAGEGLRTLMATAGAASDFADLEHRLIDAQKVVLGAFQSIVEADAKS